MTKPRRLLLVGGTGRVGKMVLHHFNAALPADIEIIEQHRDSDRTSGLYWSLLGTAPQGLADLRIDAIICLAGVTPGYGADLEMNKPLAQSVLQAAHEAGIGRVLLSSSSAVYGAGDGKPLSEASVPKPINSYGKAKLDMEQDCAPWRDKGLDVCCLRIGNVAGADALLLNQAKTPSEQPLGIDCFVDGRGPVRSYIGAGTLAEVLVNLATQPRPLPKVLNIAAPAVVFMEDLARAVGHSFEFRPAQAGSYQYITLDCRVLSALHTFDANASDATTMVAQWKETLPQ
jgi:UDP-glucose 4-epimerase